MMNIESRCLSLTDAKIISKWNYEGIYSVYNFPTWEEMLKNNWILTNSTLLEKEFLGFFSNSELIAYGRIFFNNNKISLGIGVSPTWCGKGLGKKIVLKLINESKARHEDAIISLEVRSFNKRAIRCYENVRFNIKDKYIKNTPVCSDEFYYMELN